MAGYIGGKAVNLSTSGADISGTANLDIVDIDGAVNMATTALVTGVLTANGGAVFNEGSADVDFRVESNGNANMLFVDGGNDAVGIGTSSPATKLAVSGGYISQTDGTRTLYLGSDGTGGLFGTITNHYLRFITNNTERMRIDSTGAVTMPAQPAFQVNPSSNQNNIAVNNSEVTVVFGTEVFDQNADFASNTFTAPVTGKYQLNASLYLLNIDSAADYYILKIKTSNRDYSIVLDPGRFSGDVVYWPMGFSVLADMDANDTSTIVIMQNGGTAQTDIHTQSKYSGYLVA